MRNRVCQRCDINLDLLDLQRLNADRYPFLLESAGGSSPLARYDILFACPGEALTLHADGRVTADDCELPRQDFLNALDARFNAERQTQPAPGELPFGGGWFLFLGYELVGQIEPRLCLPASSPELPRALAVRISCAVIRDHARHCLWLVTDGQDPACLDVIREDLEAVAAAPPPLPLEVEIEEEDSRRYLDAVRQIKTYIRDGDVFQVNLSRRWQARSRTRVDVAALYERLRQSNPAPFAGLMNWQGNAICSSSPERLVAVRGTGISTRPIAGTRPRGREQAADREYSRQLLAHPKERAEHVMLIDLERNDLGRVCIPGSVEVNELMVLESYAHVHHIVSNVRGRLRPGITPGQVIRAVFPGGTITGCPKVRCMEIIAELEQVARGPYTGSMGYLDLDGSMDLNILIRTLQVSGDNISWRAGAGIVADSDPYHELEETRAKARGLLLALAAGAA